MSEREIKEGIREAIYNFIWQTAHLYKDAPGGKLACPQRSIVERYVNTKITIFDFMLERANSKSEIKRAVERFLQDLEENFKSFVYQERRYLSYYQEMKDNCLSTISGYINE